MPCKPVLLLVRNAHFQLVCALDTGSKVMDAWLYSETFLDCLVPLLFAMRTRTWVFFLSEVLPILLHRAPKPEGC